MVRAAERVLWRGALWRGVGPVLSRASRGFSPGPDSQPQGGRDGSAKTGRTVQGEPQAATPRAMRARSPRSHRRLQLRDESGSGGPSKGSRSSGRG